MWDKDFIGGSLMNLVVLKLISVYQSLSLGVNGLNLSLPKSFPNLLVFSDINNFISDIEAQLCVDYIFFVG